MNTEALSLYTLAFFAALAAVQQVRGNPELRELFRRAFRRLDKAAFAVCKFLLPSTLFNPAPKIPVKKPVKFK